MSRRSFESANQTKKKQPVTLPESEASSEDSTSCSDDDAEYKEPSRKRSRIRRNGSVTGKNSGNAKKKAMNAINDRNTSPESKASSEEPSSAPSESRKRPRSPQTEENPSKRTKIWTAEAAELFKEHKFWAKTMSKKFVKEHELSSEQLRSFLKKHRTAERKKLGLNEKEYKEKYPESAAPGYDEDDEPDESEPRVWTDWAKIGPIARELFAKHKYWSPEMTAEFQKEHSLSDAQLHSFLKKRRREDMKKLNLSRAEYKEKFYVPFKRALESREEKEQEDMAQKQVAPEDTEYDAPDVSNYRVWTSEARRILKTDKFWTQEFTAEFQKKHNVGKEQLHSFLKKRRESERKKLGLTHAEYKKLFPIPAYNQEIHRGKNGQFVSVPAKRKIERGQETNGMGSKRRSPSEKPGESEDEDIEDSEDEGHEDRFYDVQFDDPVYDIEQMEEFVQEQENAEDSEGAGHESDDEENTTEFHQTGSDCGTPYDSPHTSDDDDSMDTDVPPPVPPHRCIVDFGEDQDLEDASGGDEQDDGASGEEQKLEDEEYVPEQVQNVSEEVPEALSSLQDAQEATMDEEDQEPEQEDDDGDDLAVVPSPDSFPEPSSPVVTKEEPDHGLQQVQVQPADPQNDENEPIRPVQQIRRVHFPVDEQLEHVRFISPRREVEEDDDDFSPDASPEACYQHLEEPEVQVEVEPAVALPSHSNQLSFEDQEEIQQLVEEDRLTKEDSFAAEHQESCEPVIAREEPVPTVKAPKRGRKRGSCGRKMTTAKEVSPPAQVPIVEDPAVDPEEKPLIPIPLKRNSRYDKPQPPPCQFVQLDRPLGGFEPWFMQENWKSGVFPEHELKKGIAESEL